MFAIAAAVLVAVVALALPCSAVSVYSVDSYWGDVSTTFGYQQGTYGGNYACETTYSKVVRDWSIPFPGDVLLPYLGEDAALIRSYNASVGSYATLAAKLVIKYKKPVLLSGGESYAFFFEVASVATMPNNSSWVVIGVRLLGSDGNSAASGVTCTFAASTLSAYKDTCFKVSILASEDVTFSAVEVLFQIDDAVSYYGVDVRMRFSAFAQYSGDPGFSEKNPQLDEIKGAIDDIKGQPGDTADSNPDIFPGLDSAHSEIDDISGKEGVIADKLQDFLDALDVPDGNDFFTQVGAFLQTPSTLNALMWWGDRFDLITSFQPMTILLIFSLFTMLTGFVFGCCRYARFKFSSRDAEEAQAETKGTANGWDTSSKSSFDDDFLDKALAKTYRDFGSDKK